MTLPLWSTTQYMFGSFEFFFLSAFMWLVAFSVGLVHCLQDLQTSFFNKIFIKNGSHGIIHIFKNYFTIVFSVFTKISGIQIHLQCTFGLAFFSKCVRLRFICRSMGTIHGSKKVSKHSSLSLFGSYSTIYTFKNYFVTVFSVTNFQFSANMRYPN